MNLADAKMHLWPADGIHLLTLDTSFLSLNRNQYYCYCYPLNTYPYFLDIKILHPRKNQYNKLQSDLRREKVSLLQDCAVCFEFCGVLGVGHNGYGGMTSWPFPSGLVCSCILLRKYQESPRIKISLHLQLQTHTLNKFSWFFIQWLFVTPKWCKTSWKPIMSGIMHKPTCLSRGK